MPNRFKSLCLALIISTSFISVNYASATDDEAPKSAKKRAHKSIEEDSGSAYEHKKIAYGWGAVRELEEPDTDAAAARSLFKASRSVASVSSGSRINMWKQDPTDALQMGVRVVYLPTPVSDGIAAGKGKFSGPGDAEFKVVDMPSVVRGDAQRDFLFSADPSSPDAPAFDSAHTFTVIRTVFDTYTRTLQSLQDDGFETASWFIEAQTNWKERGPIVIRPYWSKVMNAQYSRTGEDTRGRATGGKLEFGFFDYRAAGMTKTAFTCRSFDIVAHESGHAVLDAIKPAYWAATNAQTGGFHESFGDMTALFSVLAQADECEAIVALSKGNLHDPKSFLPALASEFGLAIQRPNGLRNADEDITLRAAGTEVHDLSRVFTGAIYDVLVDGFNQYTSRNSSRRTGADSLLEVGKFLRKLVFRGILQDAHSEPSYSDLASSIFAAARDYQARADGDMLNPARLDWTTFIKAQFERRGVSVADSPFRLALEAEAVTPGKVSLNHLCRTLVEKKTHGGHLRKARTVELEHAASLEAAHAGGGSGSAAPEGVVYAADRDYVAL